MKGVKNTFLTLLIGGLLLIVFLQRCGDNPKDTPLKSDTTIMYDTIILRDTVKGPIRYIKSEPDIDWVTDTIYKPDTNYNKLLDQYRMLGDNHFTLKTYETIFSLGQYGTVKVIDKIKSNELIENNMISDLRIPKETIMITEPSKPVRQVYLGLEVFGNPKSLITGAQTNVLYKDKKDRVFGAGVGWNGEIQYSVSSYWKLKLNNK